MLMKRDRGFTLIELMVVIAIMALIAGAGITMMGLIPRVRTRSLAQNIAKHLEKTRNSAMSFEAADITIEQRADGVYVKTDVKKGASLEHSEEKIGASSLQVWYILGSGAMMKLEGHSLTLGFVRSSGAFTYPLLDGVAQGDYCTAIVIKNGDFDKKLRLVAVTGKVILE